MEHPLHDHLRDYPQADTSSGALRHMYNVMAKNHEDQVRKLTGERYIEHAVGVEEIVHLVTNDPEILMAALGHDLVECTAMTFEKIENKFGERVANIIWGVTKDRSISDKRARNEAYLRRLEHDAEIGSVYVALADKIYNLADMIENYFLRGPAIWSNFKAQTGNTPDLSTWSSSQARAKEQLWWYRSVLGVCQRRLPDCELNSYLAELIELFEREVIG